MKNKWIKILGRRVDTTYIIGYVVKMRKPKEVGYDNPFLWKLTVSFAPPINDSIDYQFKTKKEAEKIARKLDKHVKLKNILA